MGGPGQPLVAAGDSLVPALRMHPSGWRCAWRRSLDRVQQQGGEWAILARMTRKADNPEAPIGIFDSGYGGLTVVRQIIKKLPNENIIYLGDTLRCPYGPRQLAQVDAFVQQICAWLVERGVKMIVIACNTATAAGLEHAQQTFDVPIVGVVEPGSRAAVRATQNRRVGVIATKATVESEAYSRAIRNLDAGITVFSTPTPRFVEIAEHGIRMADGALEDFASQASKVFIRPAFSEIAKEYLEPLRRTDIDTLVLGCTHFPLLKALIGGVIGREVVLIDSAKEAALDVRDTLAGKGALAGKDNQATRQFFSTGDRLDEFARFGGRVLQTSIERVGHVEFPEVAEDGTIIEHACKE